MSRPAGTASVLVGGVTALAAFVIGLTSDDLGVIWVAVAVEAIGCLGVGVGISLLLEPRRPRARRDVGRRLDDRDRGHPPAR